MVVVDELLRDGVVYELAPVTEVSIRCQRAWWHRAPIGERQAHDALLSTMHNGLCRAAVTQLLSPAAAHSEQKKASRDLMEAEPSKLFFYSRASMRARTMTHKTGRPVAGWQQWWRCAYAIVHAGDRWGGHDCVGGGVAAAKGKDPLAAKRGHRWQPGQGQGGRAAGSG